MIKYLLVFVFVTFQFSIYGQNLFTSKKGNIVHLEIAITVDSNSLRYELFNHWYSDAFAEKRQITFSIDSLAKLNKSDSIFIKIADNKIHLTDKRYRINKNIRHKKLCYSLENMRKISFAYKVSTEHKNIRPKELYLNDDLNLSEEQFKNKVAENLKIKITTR